MTASTLRMTHGPQDLHDWRCARSLRDNLRRRFARRPPAPMAWIDGGSRSGSSLLSATIGWSEAEHNGATDGYVRVALT